VRGAEVSHAGLQEMRARASSELDIGFERRPAVDSSHFLRLLTEASPDIIYLYDRVHQTYPMVAGRCREILGYSPDDLQRLGPQQVERRLIHPDDLECARAHHARQATLRDDELAQITYRMARSTGEYRLLRCRQKVFSRNRQGVAKWILGVATDVTDMANRERELEWLKAEIVHAKEQERRRIALHLHDTAVQHLVGAAMLLEGMSVDHQLGEADATLGEVRASLSRALRDMLEPLIS
jgi:PAS domain S-box-containing protein